MPRYFGTDGIRGVAGIGLTAEFAFRLGEAVGELIFRNGLVRKVLIGRDSRISGPMLESAFSAGLMSVGSDAHILGVAPTPSVAFLTSYFGFPLGCVISASHNPIEDNGIKFFDSAGMKVPDETEEELESLLEPGAFVRLRLSGDSIGRRFEASGGIDEYVKHLVSVGTDKLIGLGIVVDGAFGAAGTLAPSVLSILGARVIPLNCYPDGSRINVNCGSTNTAKCIDKVKEIGADIGVALDGDADRAIFIDETGDIVDGDQVLAMWAIHRLEQGNLPSKSIVGTVLSNKGLEVALEKYGGKLIRAAVGDKFVLREMLASGAVIGGEQSGHLIFLEHQKTGDGILTAIMAGILMRETGLPLSVLKQRMSRYPQVQLNISVKDKDACLKNSEVKNRINDLKKEMESIKGRLIVRPSGTESLIRVMTEAPDENDARRLAEAAIELFKKFSETGLVTEI